MEESKKQVKFAILNAVISAIIGAVALYATQSWLINDIEYQIVYKHAYLSAPLGQQGLTLAYDGKPLKNVSIVEFTLFNRTGKQFNDIDLMFSVYNSKSAPRLVSGGIITPDGIPSSEVIKEVKSESPFIKKYHIKVLPKQIQSEYYDAIFVFDGEKAPKMSVTSMNRNAQITKYQSWRENTIAIIILAGIMIFIFGITMIFFSLLDYFLQPKYYKQKIKRFLDLAHEMKNDKKLKSQDPQALTDAETIFALYSRPKENKYWSKIFGN